jgi:cystathionine beta-synthase/cysteine synthase A
VIYSSVLDTIGHTPVIQLRHLLPDNGAEVFVKLEAANPGGSIKDRAAAAVVGAAERDGLLAPGGTIVESTSGNFGKALAMIGAARGYRVILVIDPKVSASTAAFSAAFGAELVMVDEPDEYGSFQLPRMRKVQEILAENPGAFWTDQYNNENNPRIHCETTAREILDDVGEFDALVGAVSTGGHVSGLAKGLKEQLARLTVIAVDAVGSAAFGFPGHPYVMRGLGLAWRPGNLHHRYIDYAHRVTDQEGIATSLALARREALLVGESSGAAVFAALHFAVTNPGSRVVVVAADGGMNYITESFNAEWLAAHNVSSEVPAVDVLLSAARQPTHRPVAIRQHLVEVV